MVAAPASKFEAMRRSTRVRAEIPVRVRSTDPAHPFDIVTRTLIVNAQGCGLHAPTDLPIGVPVELAIEDRVVFGRILNSTAVDADKGSWVAGIQLDKPGNVWGLSSPPADWAEVSRTAPGSGALHPFARPAAAKPASSVSSKPAPAPTLVATPATVAPAASSGDARRKLEALTDDIAAHLRTRASADWEAWRTQAETALHQLQQQLAADLTARIGDRHSELQKSIENLSAMVELAEQRRNELAASATAPVRPPDQDVRSTSEEMSAQWLRDAEEAMSGLRTRVEQLVAQQEAEISARLAERQNAIVRHVETGAEKLDRLLAAADRALEQMEGWEKRSAASSAEMLRAAEAALEQIDQRRAGAESAVQQAAAASVEKLNAAVSAGERQLESKLQQISWDYNTQAEAAGQRLEGKLSEALNKLRESLEQHDAALSTSAQSHRADIAGSIREQLQAESDRHLEGLRIAAERHASALRQRLENQGRSDADLEAGQQKLAAGMADLVARQEQIAAQVAELQKTKAEIESIASSLPATIVAQAQQQAAVAWEQLRVDSQKLISETLGTETRRSVASLSEDVAAYARTLREQLADQAGQMAGELQTKIAASLSDRQTQIARELQDTIAVASREFSQQAQSQAENHRSAAEAVHESARKRLEEIAARSEHLLAESEAALYKSADEIISGEIARAQQQVRDSATPHVEATLAGLRDQAARIVGEHTASAHTAADRLKDLQTAAAAESASLEKQSQLARETRDQLAAASEQARAETERNRSESEAVYEAARRRLEEVAQRSERVLGETEAALLRSANEIIAGEVARAQQQIRDFAGPHLEAALSGLRENADRMVSDKTAAASAAADRAEQAAARLQSLEESAARQADVVAARQAQLSREMQDEVARAAGEFSRHVAAESQRYGSEAAARLQQLQQTGDLQNDALRKQIEQAQAWLTERTAEFRQSVHDAFLQAAGEIRGRVHSAVDTVDELIQLKSRDAIAGMESTGARHVEAITRTAEDVRRSVEAAQANAAATAEAELQKKLAETLEHFREDASRLAQSAASRWQAAMEDTLRSFPELLRVRLTPEKSQD